MTFAEFKSYCLEKAGAIEEEPLGNGSYYYKVKGMVFAIADTEDDYRLTLKCEPAKAIEIREQFSFIKPGYHINKEHWNTIIMSAYDSNYTIKNAIDAAYELVVSKLSKKQRADLGLQLQAA